MRRAQRGVPGQALVEFALLLMILILIMVVILDLGRVTYYFSAVYNAAREGARYGSVSPMDGSGICAHAEPIAIGTTLSCGTIGVSCSSTENKICVNTDTTDPNHPYILVTVVYQYTPVTPLIMQVIGRSSIPISSTAKMVVEGVPVGP